MMLHAREDYARIQDPVRLIPEDEPVFLIRGQDKVGAATVRVWADFAEFEGASPEIVKMARDHADKMDAWAKKAPDLPSDPAPAVSQAAAERPYIDSLLPRAHEAAEKAMRKYPQPNYVVAKVAEEAGEVVRGAIHYAEGRMPWTEVEGEIVQLLAMLIRLTTEGDQTINMVPAAYYEKRAREARADEREG